jgi:hypothetical protein
MALMEMVDSRWFQRGARLDQAALRDVTVCRLKSDLKDKGFHQREVKAIPFDITAMLFKKRFLSSPYAFGTTLRNYLDSHRGARSSG